MLIDSHVKRCKMTRRAKPHRASGIQTVMRLRPDPPSCDGAFYKRKPLKLHMLQTAVLKKASPACFGGTRLKSCSRDAM